MLFSTDGGSFAEVYFLRTNEHSTFSNGAQKRERESACRCVRPSARARACVQSDASSVAKPTNEKKGNVFVDGKSTPPHLQTRECAARKCSTTEDAG